MWAPRGVAHICGDVEGRHVGRLTWGPHRYPNGTHLGTTWYDDPYGVHRETTVKLIWAPCGADGIAHVLPTL